MPSSLEARDLARERFTNRVATSVYDIVSTERKRPESRSRRANQRGYGIVYTSGDAIAAPASLVSHSVGVGRQAAAWCRDYATGTRSVGGSAPTLARHAVHRLAEDGSCRLRRRNDGPRWVQRWGRQASVLSHYAARQARLRGRGRSVGPHC